jgi:hypothetical protein
MKTHPIIPEDMTSVFRIAGPATQSNFRTRNYLPNRRTLPSTGDFTAESSGDASSLTSFGTSDRSILPILVTPTPQSARYNAAEPSLFSFSQQDNDNAVSTAYLHLHESQANSLALRPKDVEPLATRHSTESHVRLSRVSLSLPADPFPLLRRTEQEQLLASESTSVPRPQESLATTARFPAEHINLSTHETLSKFGSDDTISRPSDPVSYSPSFEAPDPQGRDRIVNPGYSFRRHSYSLSREIIEHIIDAVARTEDTDDFPSDLPASDLASCSLTCRSWLAHSSHYLLSRIHFGPPPYVFPKPDMPEAYQRLQDFVVHIGRSQRLKDNVTGVSVNWVDGIPPCDDLLPVIIAAVPNLRALRLHESPMCNIHLPRSLQLGSNCITSLELGYSPIDVPVQDWLIQHLCLFKHIETLRLTQVGKFRKDVEARQSYHLRVDTLHLSASHKSVFRLLKGFLKPSCVTKLCIEHSGGWLPIDGSITAFNSFLSSCGQNIRHFFMTTSSAHGPLRRFDSAGMYGLIRSYLVADTPQNHCS